MTEVNQGGPRSTGVISTPVSAPIPPFDDHGLFKQFGTEQAARLAGHMSCELELVVKRRTPKGLVYCGDAHLVIAKILEHHPTLKPYVDAEFFGGQIEFRTDPHLSRNTLVNQLLANVGIASMVANDMGYDLVAEEYIPDEIELPANWVSPVQPRYAMYAAMYPERRDPMFRVSALQFRIGCATLEQAIAVHNVWAVHLPGLIEAGWADRRRLAVFEDLIFPPKLGKPLFPREIANKRELVALYERAGTAHAPKTHYPHVRIDAAVTEGVEHRLGGATLDPTVITARAKQLYKQVNFLFPNRVKKEAIADHYTAPLDPEEGLRNQGPQIMRVEEFERPQRPASSESNR